MPKGYIQAEVTITDPELFKTYQPLAAATIAAFGGRYIIRGPEPKVLEGETVPPRMVLIEFDSPERAMAWYNSPEYQDALKIRLASATTKAVMLIGYGEG